MRQASVQHETFVIQRDLAVPPRRVFAAWAEPAAKRAWFAVENEDWVDVAHELDFRVGGRERATGRPAGGGPLHVCNAVYQNIVPDKRIVWTYVMTLDETPISVSLATVEFRPVGQGTKLVYSEQVAFLDRLDDSAARESGCAWLMDNLGGYLSGVTAEV